MESIYRARRAVLAALVLALGLALAGCGQSNPLLGSWAFRSYQGGGQLGSMLGGLASEFSRGTVVTFTRDAMIVVQAGTQTRTPVDHYEVHGRAVTVWLRTASDLMQGRTYRLSADGRTLSRELAGTGIREVFVRAQKV